MASVKDTENR